MKVTTIIVLTACFAAAVADVNDLKNKAGRFLSLPVPEKCANRKYIVHYYLLLKAPFAAANPTFNN